MTYGLEVYNSTGQLRLQITDKTAMYSANYTGTSSGGNITVETPPAGMSLGIIDHENPLDRTLSYSGNTVTLGTSYGNYNFTTFFL